MRELSLLLNVDQNGRLCMKDLKRTSGEIAISEKEWEDAIAYAHTLDIVNGVFVHLYDKVNERINFDKS